MMSRGSNWRRVSGITLICFLMLMLLPALSGPVAAADTPGWSFQSSPTEHILSSVDAVNSSIAWAAGEGGTILKTADGGANWTTQNSGTAVWLYGITGVSGNSTTAWAAGEGGTILKTSNGGASWAIQSSGTTSKLYGVSAGSTSTAWAVGGFNRILNTSNGGTTWTNQWGGDTTYWYAVSAVDASTAWVGGSGGMVAKTTNGGASWISQASGITGSIAHISAVNSSIAWIDNGDGDIYRTTDGGAHWVNKSPVGVDTVWGFTAADQNKAWAVGPNRIVATEDGGTTWHDQWHGQEYLGLEAISAVDATTAWAVGLSGNILHTSDGGGPGLVVFYISPSYGCVNRIVDITDLLGQSFQTGDTVRLQKGTTVIQATDEFVVNSSKITCKLNLVGAELGVYNVIVRSPVGEEASLAPGFTVTAFDPTPGNGWYWQNPGYYEDLVTISAVDGYTAWAGGQKVLKTSDGGRTWVKQSDNPMMIRAVDANTAWGCDGWNFYRTVDGGLTWNRTPNSPQSPGQLNAIDAVNANTVWGVGYNSAIVKTTDGGNTWTVQQLPKGTHLTAIDAVDQNVAWTGGLGGFIFGTSNGGTTWSLQYTGLNDMLVVGDLAAVDYYTVFAVGTNSNGSGAIVKTTNSGSGWVQQNPGSVSGLSAVSAADANTVWAAGGSSIVKTTNGGTSWTGQGAGTTPVIHDICAVGSSSAWAVGQAGAILHTLPAVTSITPSSGTQNTTVNITNLAGLGFQTGATVQLKQGGTIINATSVTVVSATKITCSFVIGAPPVGSYDVVVKNPDGQEGRLKNGFTVNSSGPGPCGAGAGSSLGLIGAMMGLLSLAGAGGLRRKKMRRRSRETTAGI